MPEPSPERVTPVVQFAAAAGRRQSSAHFLSDIALQDGHLRAFLEASVGGPVTDGHVAVIATAIREVSIKALSYKFLNAITYWPAAVLFITATAWPVVNHFLFSLETTISGVLQTTLTSVAAVLFTTYQQYKQKQGAVEDALRRTLFAREELDAKIKRLMDLGPSIDLGMKAPVMTTDAPGSKKDGGAAP